MIFVWTLKDVVGLALVAIVALVLLYLWLSQWIREARCKHDGGVTENRECNAFCRQCGKNLGFIGTWRAKQQSAGDSA